MVKAAALVAPAQSYLGTPYTEMDCQDLVEACLRAIGIRRDLSGSNAWYRSMTWVGTPEECKRLYGEIPVGAFLYILDEVDAGTPQKYRDDGIGDAIHMGIYTHTGEGAIHSSQSRGCVCESKFKGATIPHGGWNRVGFAADILDYGLRAMEDVEKGEGHMVAEVTAENGSSVKMRGRPSASCGTYWDVPVGTQVEILAPGPEGWTKIRHNGKDGYMRTEFLQDPEEEVQENPQTSAEIRPAEAGPGGSGQTVSITLPYTIASALMHALEQSLGGGSK